MDKLASDEVGFDVGFVPHFEVTQVGEFQGRWDESNRKTLFIDGGDGEADAVDRDAA